MSFDRSLFEYDVGYYEYMPGLWFPGKIPPNGFLSFSRKGIAAAMNAKLDDSDVLVAAYPKSGQTWTLTIISLILQAKELKEGKEIPVSEIYNNVTFMETELLHGRTGADKFSTLEPPRIIKSHLPYELWKTQLEKHPDLKVIQILRNPRDALVSYYHFGRSEGHFGAFNGTWDQFFELYQQKRLPFGDFFQISADWYKFNSGRKNSLILRYEEMKKNPKQHVSKIVEFLGYELKDETVDEIVEQSTFKQMSKMFAPIQEKNAAWNPKRSNFIRKGEVGDWVNYFSKEQREYVDAKCKEYLEPLGLNFEYAI